MENFIVHKKKKNDLEVKWVNFNDNLMVFQPEFWWQHVKLNLTA